MIYARSICFDLSRTISINMNYVSGASSASRVRLRNPLFLMNQPCFYSKDTQSLHQTSCDQERPFTCQFASRATVDGSRNLATCS